MRNASKHIITASALTCICLCSLFAAYSGKAGYTSYLHPGNPHIRTRSRTIVSPLRRAEENTENKILVILTEFTDQSFFFSTDYFNNMLSLEGYSYDGASGSATEWLEKQFGENFKIDVVGPVKLSGERHYYGVNNSLGNDTRPGEMVAEACCLADSLKEVNFADYDCNKDGFVDNLFVFYAGEDESQQPYNSSGSRTNTDYLWSHSSTLLGGDYGKYLELDGVKVNSYACTSEIYLRYDSSTAEAKSHMAPIGTFLHELMHTFGLADMYDTDYEKSGGTAAGTWRTTCLMDAGNYNNNGNTPPNLNSIERCMLGITPYTELKEGKYTAYPVGGSVEADSYKITNPNDSTDYFILECRWNGGSNWDSYIGGTGLLLYHIDRSDSIKTVSETYGEISSLQRWNKYNQVNARPDHQCADLVEADGRSDSNPTEAQFADIKGIFFPQSNATAIGGTSSTSLEFWDGTSSNFYIYNIEAASDGSVSFKVRDSSSPVPPDPEAPPEDSEMIYIVIQDFDGTLELSVSNSYGAVVKWYADGQEISDPLQFTPTQSCLIKAVVQWTDGSQDCLTTQYNKLS